ncbi:MAG TPA: TniQ family protein, partial [Candidatus Sulfotelmatobacter sp.]|nr:TniQ family protein [Candidatus Sulfotelmatobacter sp.]
NRVHRSLLAGFFNSLLEDESGIGYLIRVSEANIFPTTNYVLNFLGICRFDGLVAHRVRSLSRLLDLPWSRLEDLIPFRLKPSPNPGRSLWRWMGYVISPLFISLNRGRVCPTCLSEAPYVRAIWDLWLVSHCPKHNGRLIDACPRCGDPISNNRPFLLVCFCGFKFVEAAAGPEAAPSSSLTAILDAAGVGMAIPRGERVEPLATMFSSGFAASRLNALLHLVFLIGGGSLGVAPGDWSGLRFGEMPSRVIEAADRAWGRWPDVDLGGLDGVDDSRLLQSLNGRMTGLGLVLRQAEFIRRMFSVRRLI